MSDSQRRPRDVDPQEETILVADNVDEFVERTRYQQILEARDEARKALRDAGHRRSEYQYGGMSQMQAKRAAERDVRSAVESYVLECEALYQKTEAGQKLWTDTEIASTIARKLFRPTLEEGQELKSIDDVRILGTAPIEIRPSAAVSGQYDVHLNGVRDFLKLPDTRIKYTCSVGLNGSRNPHASKTVKGTTQLSTPINISREAFRATNALINQLGVGVEAGAEQDSVEGDYSDILDEIDDS